ncbi:type II/IV secretion system protein [Candidatus Falkowbacteria bacterium]|nr:type II/IV secretion system protein [Candidatus Falkowbacteria bacterium]
MSAVSQKKPSEEIEETQKKAQRLGLPHIDLSGREIPNEVLAMVPEEAARFYQIIPLEKSENTLKVGLVDPDDLQAREALRFITLRSGLSPEIFIITKSDFSNCLKQYRNLKAEVGKALKEFKQVDKGAEKKGKIEVKEAAEEILAEAPITKIVDVVMKYAFEGRASDVHIEPLEKEIKVRFRVDGILHASLFLPKNVHSAVVTRIKILSNMKIDETRVPQDGRFQMKMGGVKIDLRVSVLPTMQGEKVVLRLLDPSAAMLGYKELGLVSSNLEALKKGISQPFGMILVTGPTGSGKSTTLNAVLRDMNQEGVNIISLEDPVEYYIEGVNQSQIRPEIHYTFASGLRSILRQDPDVIMVGEVRDSETAGLAVHAALTGHILLATLHTNDAVGVIPRLVDMGVEPFLIPASLNLAMAQRLVRRLCPECKIEVEPSQKVLEMIEKEFSRVPAEVLKDLNIEKPFKLYQSKGCKYCNHKGTKGRIAIFELLSMTKELERVVLDNLSEGEIFKEADRQKMITMKQDGLLKALCGIVSLEEVLRAVEE